VRAHYSSSRLRSIPETTPAGVRELMAVRAIAKAFLKLDRPEDVFQLALDQVSPIVGALLSCIYLRDGDSDVLHLTAAHNWPERYARYLGEMRVRVGLGPSGRAVAEDRAVSVENIFDDPSAADWREVADELGFRSLVAMPLTSGGKVNGAITFYFADAGGLSAERADLLRTVADQMSATSEKARLISDLRRSNAVIHASNVELERQNAALLEARRVKDQFLANISHELRTPLTTVIGYIALMQEGVGGPVTDEQEETLEQVKQSSEQLLALINDLLALTSLRRGGESVKNEPFDPRDALRDAMAAAPAARPGVAVEVLDEPGAGSLTSDRPKVAKIIGILVGNALKFTHAGFVRVRVQAEGTEVVYTVQDSGIGIPAEAHHLVFEAFRQGDATATRRYGGTGLGLSLARRLARLLGGDVTLTSRPGVGSTFRLSLPMALGSTREIQADVDGAQHDAVAR
jgi:signal transduction histidine kinase